MKQYVRGGKQHTIGGASLDIFKNVSKDEVQELLCKLTDVMHCSVACGNEGEIREIHILASTGRNIKQLVRDIQSAIHAKYGINIDYKIISIAQINEREHKEARLTMNEIAIKRMDNAIEATVTFEFNHQKYVGTSVKVKSLKNKYKALAEASLLALENYLGIEKGLYLEGIEKVIVAGETLFVCVIGFASNGREEILTGSSIISADENESVVKSVLSAVNRRVNLMR